MMIPGGLLEDPEWIHNVLEDILKINEELNAPDDESSEISKRSVETQEHNLNSSSLMPPECRKEVWQCMSGVLERGIRYVDRPETFYTSLQPVLYKAVFHGGVKTMWSSVMEVSRNLTTMREIKTVCVRETLDILILMDVWEGTGG